MVLINKPELYSLRFCELNLTKDLLKTTMGYSEDKEYPMLDDYIDEVFELGSDLCDIRGGYILAKELSWVVTYHSLIIGSISLEIGKIIYNQLKKSTGITVFLCTAGNKIHDKSRQFMSEGDLLKGYVYDVFGSLAVEAAIDIIQNDLKDKLLSAGSKITNRYSPGYCGWNIAEQSKLFKLLPEKFCGVELTDTCLMVPIKSVSGIIGIGETVKFNPYTCNICESTNCLYRNLKNK